MRHTLLRITLLVVLLMVAAATGCSDSPSLPVYQPDWGTPQDGVQPGVDVAGGQDGQVTDDTTPLPDGVAPADGVDPRDVPIGGDEGVAPPLETFRVVSAFSADGSSITVRFNYEVDPATGGDAGSYEFLEGTTPMDVLTSASVDGNFARLTVAPGTAIDPDYTYKVRVSGVLSTEGEALDPAHNQAVVKRSVYLNIVWHQHQPLYLDALKDELQGPWVRKHATKDYYDMAAVLADYPEVHVTINLTVVMLNQLQLYVDRLGPYVDPVANTVDETAFLDAWRGHTDPWVDLLLDDTPLPRMPGDPVEPGEATDRQLDLLYAGPWSCVSTNEHVLKRFPEYEEVRRKSPAALTQDDFRLLKVMFEIAWMDPDFLDGPVTMPNGWVVDLSDVVRKDEQGRYWLRVPVTEELANRLVAEEYKIMANVVPIHREMRYDPATNDGQIEIATTPFYHPILPLVYDTDLAAIALPGVPLPNPAYRQAGDASAHVWRAVAYYEDLFGQPPTGMWPGEGSVAEAIVHIFRQEGIELTWVATDQDVLRRSTPSNQPHYYPYRVDGDEVAGDGGATDDELMIVFRDQALSNKVGFTFQILDPDVAADEFIRDVLAQAPRFGGQDRLVSVILDGENAWEEYQRDHDAKRFFHALYSQLDRSSREGEIVPVTPTEYVTGNPSRGILAHPVHDQIELEPLWAGSWIGASYDIWIGEGEENLGWQYLSQARADLESSGLPRPNPLLPEPDRDLDPELWAIWKAWDEIYAAEGSDWFWWYGQDMTSPSHDDSPFDQGFRSHLEGMYSFANQALDLRGQEPLSVPSFAPIIQPSAQRPAGPFTTAPVIDGALSPNETEWTTEGGVFYDQDSSGTMANANDDIKEVFYGYTSTHLYVAVRASEDLSAKLGSDYALQLYLSQKHIVDLEAGTVSEEPANTATTGGTDLSFKDNAATVGGATWLVDLSFAGASLASAVHKADGGGGWIAATTSLEVAGPLAGGKVIELRIPFEDLLNETGDPLEFVVVAVEGGAEIDMAPNIESYQVFEDQTSLVYVTWEVDVSGSLLGIDTYGPINTPPPPAGDGIVYIAGNQPSLGLDGEDWTPNAPAGAMRDDGQSPDETAEDRVWTIRKQFARGTLLRWKYTIGTTADEGRWSGTEEFPLTERGFTLPMNPDVARVTFRETFADRPQPTGSMASHTQIVCEDKSGDVVDPCM